MFLFFLPEVSHYAAKFVKVYNSTISCSGSGSALFQVRGDIFEVTSGQVPMYVDTESHFQVCQTYVVRINLAF